MNRSQLLIASAFLAIASHAGADAPLLNTPAAHKNYIRKAQAQINYLAVEIQKAERNMNRVKTADKAECEETVKRLWKKERLARVRLEAIKKASNALWPSLRKQEDQLLVHLQKSYQHLVNAYFK